MFYSNYLVDKCNFKYPFDCDTNKIFNDKILIGVFILANKDIKKVEDILYDYKDLDIKIKSIEIDIEMLQNDITLKAINYDEKLGPTNAFSSSVENEVIRRDEVVKEQIQKLQRDKLLYISRKNKIENALGLLTKEERMLVGLRYFSRPKKSWVEISRGMNIANTHCCAMRLKVIDKIKKYIY